MMNKLSFRWYLLLAALMLAVFVLAACGGQQAAEQAAEKPTLKLAVNPWSGSAVNVAVAKALLTEKLGYKVDVVDLDENATWAGLAKGDLDASLEVWPSGHAADKAEYIDKQKAIEDGGPLGVVGKISWYEPKYVVDQHPELATWEGFQNPDLAKLFATAETGDKGQFLAGDPSFVQYDDQIIANLGLPMQVVVAGSEQALLAALDSAYSRQEPVLFYFWTPHSIHAKYDLVPVQLPPYSDECYAKAADKGVDCDYPDDVLYKIFSNELKTKAPDAYAFLKNFNYSTEDQIALIAAVELDKKTADEAAKAWIDANQAKWEAWLPK